MRESAKAGVHFGLAAGHAGCLCYHIHKGGVRNWHVLFHAVAFTYDFLAMVEHSRREAVEARFERLRFFSAECFNPNEEV